MNGFNRQKRYGNSKSKDPEGMKVHGVCRYCEVSAVKAQCVCARAHTCLFIRTQVHVHRCAYTQVEGQCWLMMLEK